jgi:hypothetical protein
MWGRNSTKCASLQPNIACEQTVITYHTVSKCWNRTVSIITVPRNTRAHAHKHTHQYVHYKVQCKLSHQYCSLLLHSSLTLLYKHQCHATSLQCLHLSHPNMSMTGKENQRQPIRIDTTYEHTISNTLYSMYGSTQYFATHKT